jgi:hypothetical protein
LYLQTASCHQSAKRKRNDHPTHSDLRQIREFLYGP